VIFAVSEETHANGKLVQRETQVATYLLRTGDSVSVTSTEQFGAAHINLAVGLHQQ
jgi:hypothetical protein